MDATTDHLCDLCMDEFGEALTPDTAEKHDGRCNAARNPWVDQDDHDLGRHFIGYCRKRPIKGGTVCATHGGAAPQVREAANRNLEIQAARKVLGTYGIVEDVDSLPPLNVVMELQLQAARQRFTVQWLEQEVGSAHADDLTQHTKDGEKPSVWLALLNEERRSYQRLLTDMARLGIEDRSAKAKEALAGGVLEALRVVFGAVASSPDVALTPVQAEALRVVVGQQLRALGS